MDLQQHKRTLSAPLPAEYLFNPQFVGLQCLLVQLSMVNRSFDYVMCFVWLLFAYALCSMNNLIIYGLQVR